MAVQKAWKWVEWRVHVKAGCLVVVKARKKAGLKAWLRAVWKDSHGAASTGGHLAVLMAVSMGCLRVGRKGTDLAVGMVLLMADSTVSRLAAPREWT